MVAASIDLCTGVPIEAMASEFLGHYDVVFGLFLVCDTLGDSQL